MSTDTTTTTASDVTMKRIFVGNLGNNVTTDDLVQLFGLSKSDFLKKTCSLELVTWKQNDKSKNYAFVSAPAEIYEELVKLNGIEFYGRQVKVEEARPKAATKEEESEEPSSSGRSNYYRGGRSFRGRGGYSRGGRGGRRGWSMVPGRRWGARFSNRFSVPTLEEDQIMSLIDCGVNLTNPKFIRDTDQAIARALATGVNKMVVTGLKMVGSKYAVILSKSHPNICYAAVGVHPHFVKEDWEDVKSVEQLEELIKLPHVVAVGECGLDFNRNFSPVEDQLKAFTQQVELAVKHQKPLLVHERESGEKILEVLKEYEGKLPPVVIHCFTGTADQIKVYLKKGFYIGVTGFLCKEKHGQHLREAIQDGTLPLDRIVVQTNAPYMIPNIPREQIDPISKALLEACWIENEPCTLQVIVRCVARCLNLEPSKVAQQCLDTANKIFKFQKVESSTFE